MRGIRSVRGYVRDGELWGALVYGTGLVASACLAYAFNALMGRRLSPADFGTFGALLAAMLALSGPTTALYGGAAMSAARTGRIARPAWRSWIAVAGAGGGVVGVLPVGGLVRATGWFVLAAAMWMLVSWNRGLLIGIGRIGTVGGTVIFEGFARLAIALLLVARGWGLAGAAGGLALGIGATVLLTHGLLPRRDGSDTPARVGPEVWTAAVGLFFLSAMQFPDLIAVRLFAPERAGAYAAASSLARMALYAQAPAAAYALRRTAVAGPGRSVRRAMFLALAPALAAAALLLAFPRQLLDATYGGKYLEAAGLVRTLAVAMLLAGLALVLVNLCMGAGRSGWAWSMGLVAVGGLPAIFAVAGRPSTAAAAMLWVQAAALAVAAVHAARVLAADRPADGAVLIMNWRDTRHPQGGGSEVFVEQVARRLAAQGRRVTVFCAEHLHAPRDEVVGGVRFVRRGSWRTVYLWGFAYHLLGRFGRHDVVVDVQNAVPFFTPLYCGRPVVVLVHHVHREQWRMLFGPRTARAGWWVESRLAPRLYRRADYVAVSAATRADLVNLGIDADRIAVVRNGSPSSDHLPAPKAVEPTVCYLGRLVPHKRIELLFEAAAALREEIPGLRVRVLGRGEWERRLRVAVDDLGIGDMVSFEGYVGEADRRRILGGSWVLALPSIKEGWGLAVVEAAAEGTPTVAFRVGGLQESVVDGVTGALSETYEEFLGHLRRLLRSEALRARMGAASRDRAALFTWDAAAAAFEAALDRAVDRQGGRRPARATRAEEPVIAVEEPVPPVVEVL